MRIAGVVLIVLVGSVGGHAQQLGRPPLTPAPREAQPLFPTVPLDQAVPKRAAPAESALNTFPGFEPRLTWNRSTPPSAGSPQNAPSQRSGPVCLRSVPVDPSIDPGFVKPVPTDGFAMRTLEMPNCVTLGSPQP